MGNDGSADLQAQLEEARAKATPLRIEGGNSKSFYGRHVEGHTLSTRKHHGIVNYEPTELVLTARAGTSLAEVEQLLWQHRQSLPFEPPQFGAATVGGMIACGLSGPRRPYAGATRDYVLGCRVLTGKGDVLHFGGEVMKNVAGYDVARLMTGALGTLGVLLEVSLKVLPVPDSEITLSLEMNANDAIQAMNHWACQSVPLSAACHDGQQLYMRLSGGAKAVNQAVKTIGGDAIADNDTFWQSVREQTHAFFTDDRPLWRLSLAPGHPVLSLEGNTFLDWGGAQRWLSSDIAADTIRQSMSQTGGHATLFRGHDGKSAVFQPLPAKMKQLHQRLKHTFDPDNLLNPGRMYPDL